MGLNYVNLDDVTRRYMSEEIEFDMEHQNFHSSNFLNEHGKSVWPSLLAEAVQHNDDWLANEIQRRGMLASHYPRRKSGSTETTMVKVPVTAAQTMAEGEFNRLYARGLCARAIAEHIISVEVYRARYSATPREESQRMIGTRFLPQDILQDLRSHPGIESALSIPGGPNSGISIKL
ncbi:hypothetical protein ACQ3G4_11600 [bacterium BS0013]